MFLFPPLKKFPFFSEKKKKKAQQRFFFLLSENKLKKNEQHFFLSVRAMKFYRIATETYNIELLECEKGEKENAVTTWKETVYETHTDTCGSRGVNDIWECEGACKQVHLHVHDEESDTTQSITREDEKDLSKFVVYDEYWFTFIDKMLQDDVLRFSLKRPH